MLEHILAPSLHQVIHSHLTHFDKPNKKMTSCYSLGQNQSLCIMRRLRAQTVQRNQKSTSMNHDKFLTTVGVGKTWGYCKPEKLNWEQIRLTTEKEITWKSVCFYLFLVFLPLLWNVACPSFCENKTHSRTLSVLQSSIRCASIGQPGLSPFIHLIRTVAKSTQNSSAFGWLKSIHRRESLQAQGITGLSQACN